VLHHDPLDGLNPVQREAVTHEGGPVLIVAGAGSGKTRVLTHRIAWLTENKVSPFSILAITFTNKAAAEMKARVQQLVGGVAERMWVSTFHSSCTRILRREAPRLGYKSNFSIYDASDSERLIKHCMRDLNIDPKRIPPRAVSATISDSKNKLMDAGLYADFAANPWERKVAEIYVEYQKRLLAASAMDFDDLIMRCVEIFDRFDDAREHYQDRFEHVLVDEFQDTNHAQARWATLIAGKHRNIFVVGDADQGIYAFRGATIKNLLDFERDWPEAKVITLEQNYRSTQTILSAANAVIEHNVERRPKSLWTQEAGGELITRYHAQNEHDESAWVAGEVSRLRDQGHPLADMAIFYRTNAQSRVLEETFSQHEIPYRLVGGVGFYDRKEIKDVMAWLRSALNPADTIAIARVTQAPRRGIGDTTLNKLTFFAANEYISLGEAFERAEEVDGINKRALNGILQMSRIWSKIRDAAEAKTPVAEIIAMTWDITGYMEELTAERTFESLSRQENLRELAGVAKEYDESNNDSTLGGFLEQVALITDTDQTEGEEEGVTFMTLHNAKGLEYPIVFIVGMEEGVFPHIRSIGEPDQLEEERRLCYVGITRARQRLYLLNAWSRSLWGGLNYNPPSRFLNEIPDELVARAQEIRGTNAKGKKAESKEKADPHSFRVGQEVEHDRWGRGTIVEIARSSLGMEATIHFPQVGGEKRLDLTLAPLKPLS
jgi:DNA helicase II / ATP-dependent DNA helicase PcrA